MGKEELSIIKIGGNIIEDDRELKDFLKLFTSISGKKILVHGGGKKATQLAAELKVPTTMIDGRRITDTETLEVITMVYAGLINKNITAILQSEGSNAIGMSGADGNCIKSVKRPVKKIDYGWVGDVVSVNDVSIKKLLDVDFIPVFCALTHDGKGQLLNTNADTIAAELGMALSKIYQTKIYYCFELPGVLEDIHNPSSLLKKLNLEGYQKLKTKGLISMGMLPKLENCFHALANGVQTIYIGNKAMFTENETNFTSISLA